jgi:hypothetical protein
MTCITCRISQPIESGAEQLAKILNGAIAPQVAEIFQGFLILWALYTIIVKGIIRGDIKLASTIEQLCMFSLVGLLLKSNYLLWDLIYNPLKHVSQGLVQTILNSGLANGSYASTSKGYIAAIDGIMQQVVELGKAADWSWGRPFDAIASFFLMLLYILVGAISVAWVLEYIFIVFWVSSFSSILLLCLAFPATRKNAYNALFSLLGSLFTICFSIMSMSLTLMVYRDIFRTSVGGWITWGADFLSLVMLGLISIFMQGKARNLASNITGVSDGAGMAMTMAGAGTAAISMAATGGVGVAVSKGAAAVSKGVSSAKKAWDTYKSRGLIE